MNIPEGSKIAGRSIAKVFDQFPDLLAVAIIRDHLIQLPEVPPRSESEINC
jgi:Trk K+ transport system NAD-binding subunit